ncbi:MAG: hypothetical protein CL488_01995 [Acidobacteria bacterium]|nr:hypothetical protein [Acidobacteriota bacterium]
MVGHNDLKQEYIRCIVATTVGDPMPYKRDASVRITHGLIRIAASFEDISALEGGRLAAPRE